MTLPWPGPRRIPWKKCGRGRPNPAVAIVEQQQPAGRVRRLEPRALHHGRGALAAPSPRCSSSSTSQGLIYKDKRLGQLNPRLADGGARTSKVESIEIIKGNLWHIKYPIEDSDQFITVATTRPETMLGDTAVAVHPDDERYKALVGKMAVLPLTGRLVPIIADELFRSRKRYRHGQDHARP